MLKFNGNKALIIMPNGEYKEYKVNAQILHQDIINDFCNKMNYDYPSEITLIKNNHIYFRIVDDTIIAYLPNQITEMQLYQLELLIPELENVTYLGIVKENMRTSYKECDICSKFSEEIIQEYIKNKSIKNYKR